MKRRITQIGDVLFLENFIFLLNANKTKWEMQILEFIELGFEKDCMQW